MNRALTLTKTLSYGYFFWVAIAFIPALAQGQDKEQIFVDPAFTLDHWTVEDGLPVNSVNQVLQTEDGYLWLATYDGLVRFDGVRFEVYKTAEYPGLPTNRIFKLINAADGILWMQVEGDRLVKFSEGRFQLIDSTNGLNGKQVYDFLKLQNTNELLICSSNGITIYKDGTLRPYQPDFIKGPVTYVYKDDKGILWYKSGNNAGLYRFDGAQSTFLVSSKNVTDTTPVLTLENNRTLLATLGHIYRYRNETLEEIELDLPSDFMVVKFYQPGPEFPDTGKEDVLVATANHGLYKLSGNSLRQIAPEFNSTQRGVFQDSSTSPWIAGQNQLLYHGKLVFSFKNDIRQKEYDQEGSLWFGSGSSGLYRLKPNPFIIYSEEEGVPKKNIYPVYETSDHSIWFGTHGKGLVRLKDGHLHTYYLKPPDGGLLRSIVERSNGDILSAVYGNTLYRLNTKKNTFEPTSSPSLQPSIIQDFVIEALFEDSQHRLWAGSTHGLFWKGKDGDEWHRIPDKNSDPGYTVRYFSEAPDSSLWMATAGGGILHFHNGTFTTYTTEDGLSSNLVRSIYVDTLSSSTGYVLWIGSEDKGLNRLKVLPAGPDFSTIVAYDNQTGLYDNVIHQILVDDYNRFWMSTNRGIFWVSREQLNQFARGEISRIHSTSYTEKDGLRNREANGGIQPAGIKASDGKLWFPTQDGLVGINPSRVPWNNIPPPVHIEEIHSKNAEIEPGQNGMITLEARQREFEINYTGLSFVVPEKVRFRYRLKGFDDQWTEAGIRRTAFYTNVPPGEYQFEMLAANNEGIWSKEPVAISITILPYFYETTLFYFSLVLIAGFMVWGTVQLRTRHLKNRQKVLEKSVKERTEEISQQKEIIERQAEAQQRFFTNVSHELRTPLTLTIGPLEDLKGNGLELQEQASSKITLALRNAKRLLTLVSQILDINRLEASKNKVAVSKYDLAIFVKAIAQNFSSLANRRQIQFDIHTPRKLETWFNQDQIEKVITNLLSNAFKFTENGSRISIQLNTSGENQVKIEVQDLGMGISEEELPYIFDRFYQSKNSKSRLQHGTGIGLALVKHLVLLHGGTIEVASTVGKGTTFTVTLPVDAHKLPHAVIEETPEYSSLAPAPIVDGEDILSLDNSSRLEQQDHTTILVIEDNLELRQFVADHLRCGYRVIEAVHGKEGLEKAKELLPDIIVSDVMMPEMNGFEFVEQLRADTSINFIPVIMLTGKDTKEDTLKGLEYGADDYIVKPFDMDELKARVKSILRSQKLLQARFEADAPVISLKKENLKSADQEFVENVQQVIRDNLGDSSLSVEKLAKLVNVGRTTLHRKLTDITDETPVQLIRRIRLEQAKHMIENKTGTISEIAYSVGFESISWFSKCFKERYDVNPSKLLSAANN